MIVHSGQRSVLAGRASEEKPSIEFPTVVGRPRHQGVMVGMGQKDSYVGFEATGASSGASRGRGSGVVSWRRERTEPEKPVYLAKSKPQLLAKDSFAGSLSVAKPALAKMNEWSIGNISFSIFHLI